MHLLASSCLILASTVTGVAGFTTISRPSSSVQQQQQQPATSTTALQSSSSTANNYYNHPTNSPSLLELASQCATSDSCSIDMAELYLREIFHAQSGCIAMTGNPNVDSQMCENVDVVAEVVANLRHKISSSSIVAQQAKNLLPLSTVMTAAAIVVAAEMTLLFHSNSIAAGAASSPITMQEMYWAIRDGYIGDVMSHVFHNGGLLVNNDASMVSSTASSSSSLTPQELFWSVRDGYASTVALNSGGGIGDGDSSGNVVVPFTPQEVWWAIQNGYVNDLTVHLFRNGGLLV
jgi:Tfp pilus assembly protein PilV